MKGKVITKVLNVGEKTKEMMVEYFDEFKREKTPPYAILQADDGDTVVTLYQSGKAVFQGRDADLAADFWIETERINYGNAKVTSSEDKKEKKETTRKIPLRINSIGSDEVGTGDYFGPIVVTASYVTKDNNITAIKPKKLTVFFMIPSFNPRKPPSTIVNNIITSTTL